MELGEAILKRRSIRKYESQPVPPEKIERILTRAGLAPSWKNGQCWRFLIISSPEKREQLATCLPSDNPGRKSFAQAPVVLVLCVDPQESAYHSEKPYWMFDAGLATQNLLLAATEEGLGTCCIGMFDEEEAKKILGVPPGIRVVLMTPLGYPAQEPKPRPRKNLAEFAFQETWGNPL